MTSPLQQLPNALEHDERLDPLAGQVGGLMDTYVKPGPVKDLLAGTWFGHPIHPPLTAATIGLWMGSVVLDVFGGKRSTKAADRLIFFGILSAGPTVATGLNEFADTDGRPKRLAFWHGTGNAVVLSLFTLSWLSRKAGMRGLGKLLSFAGIGLGSVTAHLGGHLSFIRGVGVNQTAFERPKVRWTPVLDESALQERKLTRASLDGVDVVLYRVGDRTWALSNRCSHRGGLLSRGKVVGSDEEPCVQCPWHASIFRFEDGAIERGPATAEQPVLEARINEGKVELRAAGGGGGA
jgi:nitrite reductase/ring-hydroxylating ferredoxin subunit/uncharacterized membrane protein